MLHQGNESFEVGIGDSLESVHPAEPGRSRAQLLRNGLEHVRTGYAPLAFLLGLLILAAGSWCRRILCRPAPLSTAAGAVGLSRSHQGSVARRRRERESTRGTVDKGS